MLQANHTNTPTLRAIDSRGSTVRTVEYWRAVSDERPLAQISRSDIGPGARHVSTQDARLSALRGDSHGPHYNQTTRLSLTGVVIHHASTDAGWTVDLYVEADEPLIAWDGRGTRRRVAYDSLRRPLAVYEQAQAEAERCTERFVYGGPEAASVRGSGRILRHDDPAGSTSVTSFTLLGHPTSQVRRFLPTPDTPDWPEDTVERDALLEAESYETTWHYDATGDTVMQTDARGHRQIRRHHIDGGLASVTLKLAHVQDEQTLVQDTQYDAMGNVCQQTAGNDVTCSAQYRPQDGRLQALRTKRSNGDVVQSLLYDYDPAGNIVRIEDDLSSVHYHRNRRIDGVSTYTYDTLNRLIAASGRESAQPAFGPALPASSPDDTLLSPYTQTYEYDAADNLTRLRHTGVQAFTRVMAVAPTSNRALIHADGLPPPDFDAGFDANGNMQELEPGQRLQWNLRNQLASLAQVVRDETSDNASDDERYAYDGDGMRVRKLTRQAARRVAHTREVRYLPGIEIRTNSATAETLHVIAVPTGRIDVRVLHWVSEPPDGLDNDAVRYRLDDHLNSTVCELDADANVASREGYYPFGTTAWQSGRHAVEVKYRVFRYSGKERDASGLYAFGFRYYAPRLQRWINPDPAGDADGLNRFAMVGNNPVSRVDRWGLLGEPPEASNWERLGGLALAIASVAMLAWATIALSRRAQAQASPTRVGGHFSRTGPGRTPMRKKNAESHWSQANRARIEATQRTSAASQTSVPSTSTAPASASAPGPSSRVFERQDSTWSTASAYSTGTHASRGSRKSSGTGETESLHRGGSIRDSKRSGRTPLAPVIPEVAAQAPAAARQLWRIRRTERFESQLRHKKMPQLAATRIDVLIDQLVQGELPGKYEPVEGVEMPGKVTKVFSADVIGFGSKGRGAYRLLYTAEDKNFEINVFGIGNYHAEGGGMKPVRWWPKS